MFFKSSKDVQLLKNKTIEAQKGDSEAQMIIAAMHFNGRGTRRSAEKFEFWLACSYLNGNRQAAGFVADYCAPAGSPMHKYFFNELCPLIIRKYPQYIPRYYKK